MKIENFEYIDSTSSDVFSMPKKIDGIVEYIPSSGFCFTKITKIDGKEEDNVILRSKISHSDILLHIKMNGQC